MQAVSHATREEDSRVTPVSWGSRMADYKLHCVGASGNSYKIALYLNCAGLNWEPVGVDFAGGQTRDPKWRADNKPQGGRPGAFGAWETQVPTRGGILLVCRKKDKVPP